MSEKSALIISFLIYLLFLFCSYLINSRVFHSYHLIIILRIYIVASTKIAYHFRKLNCLENRSQDDRILFQDHIKWDILVHHRRLKLFLTWLIL